MTEPASPPSWSRDLLLLTLVFGLFFAFRLGSRPLANPDEGRNAEIAREMIVSGDWVTPRLNGVNYFEKPPLVYWAVAAAIEVLGPNEWAVRTVPAVFALGGVLLTYAAARNRSGRSAGLAAALVLGTSLLYFALGRFLLLDLAVSVFMSATLFAFALGVRESPGPRRRAWFYALYASAALATLTKGLMGFLVTGAVMFLWLLAFNQWKRLRPLYLPTGALLFLAVAAPWHLLAALRNPTWVHRYIAYEHFERFLSPVAGRPGPWWYFVPIVLVGFFPWTGFLWRALRSAAAGGWSGRGAHADSWFLLTWIGFVFLFFSVSHSKLPPYILPIFPPLAVLVGAQVAAAVGSPHNQERAGWPLAGFAAISLLLAVALFAVVTKPGLIRNLPESQAAALHAPGLLMAGVLATGAVLSLLLARWRGARAGITAMVAAFAVFCGALTWAASDIQKPGTQALALQVTALARPGDRVVHYHEFFHDFTFYAARVVDVVAFKGELELEEDATAQASGRFIDEAAFRRLWSGNDRVFAVARKRDVRALFADPAFSSHLLGETEDHYLFSNHP